MSTTFSTPIARTAQGSVYQLLAHPDSDSTYALLLTCPPTPVPTPWGAASNVHGGGIDHIHGAPARLVQALTRSHLDATTATLGTSLLGGALVCAGLWHQTRPGWAALAGVLMAAMVFVVVDALVSSITHHAQRESDVALAVLLALTPAHGHAGPGWLPPTLLRQIGQTILTHHRDDGTLWRPERVADQEAVAALLCHLAEMWHTTPTPQQEQRLHEIITHLPDDQATCRSLTATL